MLTTHSMEEADVLGDRVAIMSHGKIQAIGYHFAARRLHRFPRQPALLEPPAIDRTVRDRVVSKSAAEMLDALELCDNDHDVRAGPPPPFFGTTAACREAGQVHVSARSVARGDAACRS